ncbi:MAG: hypothetical protein NTW86_05030 [Candidatus Sumerlaeota bacterium]|nr:hypothetical protein [Candidatus Sumerlaeota bacterium]
MGKGLFTNRFSRSVQSKIDLLKKRRKKNDSSDLPAEPPAEEQLTPEELEYLKRLQEGLLGNGPSAPAEPVDTLRLSRDNGSEREADEEDRSDPFSHAEREVERLIQEAETRHRSRALKAAPPAPEPPAAEDEAPTPPSPAREEPPPPRRARAVAPSVVEPLLEPLAEEPEGTPPPPPEPAPAPRRAAAEDKAYDRQGKLPYPPGTVVRMGNEVGIIKEEISNREYDLVYLLCADGRIEPRGVTLYSYDLERLGRLPREELNRISKRQFWDRDRLIYYLDDISFARGIPLIVPKGEAESASTRLAQTRSEPHDDGHSLLRGRRLSIVYGDKSWEAIYWGQDEEGPIVAHAFGPDEWELMRLDLNRFGDSLKRGRLMSDREIKAIEEQVVQKIERQSKD